MKKVLMLIAHVTMVIFLLAGCGEAAPKAPQGEKILIEGKGGDCVTLDPFNATDIASWRVARQIYDTLVGFEEASFNLTPSLATSWETSEDGTIYIFTLREGVKFHDGTDFNADAVVFNTERWWDESHEYHNGTFGNVVNFFGGFKGDPACRILDVQALDKYRVQFTLSGVFPAFLARLTDPSLGIISPAAIKKHGKAIGQNPVGTGPFAFQAWIPNDSITLAKNTEYWQNGLPKLDKLIFKVIPDNTARLIALQAGEIDIMDSLNASDLKVVNANSKLQLITRPAINCGFFWFNMTVAPFDNVKVRRAVCMAIDRQGLIDSIYGGLAIPAKSILSPSSWAYNDDIVDYEYDPKAAKALLDEAGYPDGFSTQIWVRGEPRAYFPQPQKMAQSMQADLAEIGINATIVTYDGPTYSNYVYGAEYTMAAWGTGGSDPDPSLAISHYFIKTYAETKVASNAARYINDEVSELLERARNILDQEERTELYRRAQQIIHDDAPVLTMFHTNSLMAAADYVKNYTPFTDYYELYLNVDIVK